MKAAAAWCAILAAAAGFRAVDLGARPMHADEAILADKFGTLLESGAYEYDARDYHGPLLLYATLPAAWMAGAHRYADLRELVLRGVPAVAGIALVSMTLLLAPGLGRKAALAAAGLTAIAPAMVYYSRYYIPEILLALFSFSAIACGYRYAVGGGRVWAVPAGMSVGLMFAAKETALIALAAMLVGVAVCRAAGPRPAWVLVGAIAAIALVPGAWKALPALPQYVDRGLHPEIHRHPWYYYLALLRSEALVVALGAAGLVPAFRKGGLTRFLAVYATAMTVAYSLIPYKTPWCLVGFLHGWILLAGWTIASLPKKAGLAAGAAVAAVLAWQAYSWSFTQSSDPVNPYVYAHTGKDVFTITRRIEQLAAAHPEGRKVPVQVVSDRNMWPLPWYLRAYPNVEWWRGVGEGLRPAPLILVSPEMETALADRIYSGPPEQREMYVAMFDGYTELRPQVELRGYARKSLWDRASIEKP